MRKIAYKYLLLWPILAALFTLLVDYQAREFRISQLYDMSRNYQADMLRLAYGIVKEAGVATLHPNQSQEFESLDIYLADNDQQAVTKPRFSQVGTTITNKAIIRALEKEPGDIDTWISPADYRGIPVVAAYTSIDIDGERYAMICEIDQEEVMGRVEAWWFFSDVLWILFFAAIDAACIYYLKDDIIRAMRPIQEKAESAYTMLIKAIMQFPVESTGVALVDSTGIISHCSPSFAKILGALMTREVIGTSVHSYHRDPDRHRQYFESFTTDMVERPVVCVGADKQDRPVLLSISKLNGLYLVVLRARETN
jgi:PAS domain-containing protein